MTNFDLDQLVKLAGESDRQRRRWSPCAPLTSAIRRRAGHRVVLPTPL